MLFPGSEHTPRVLLMLLLLLPARVSTLPISGDSHTDRGESLERTDAPLADDTVAVPDGVSPLQAPAFAVVPPAFAATEGCLFRLPRRRSLSRLDLRRVGPTAEWPRGGIPAAYLIDHACFVVRKKPRR